MTVFLWTFSFSLETCSYIISSKSSKTSQQGFFPSLMHVFTACAVFKYCKKIVWMIIKKLGCYVSLKNRNGEKLKNLFPEGYIFFISVCFTVFIGELYG